MGPPKYVPKNPATERLSIRNARHYVKIEYGIDVTRQTLYNWVKRGVEGVKLRTFQLGPRFVYTTREWIDGFINSAPRQGHAGVR